MQHSTVRFVRKWVMARPAAALLFWFVHSAALAQDNVWTNFSGGLWESPSWSLGQPGGSAIITNPGNKTILIGPSTWANYSNSLDVSPFNLSGTEGSTNRLLIDGGAAPIVFRCTGQIGINGVLENRGATLQLFASRVLIEGTLLQSGGVLESSLLEVYGKVCLTNSIARLYDYLSIPYAGEFQQAGGTLDGPFLNIRGTYRFDNGVINGGGLSMGGYGGGHFYQTKGTLNLGSLAMGTAMGTGGYTTFLLSAGTISAGDFSIGPFSSFTQQGGSVNVTNELALSVYVDRHGPLLGRYALTNGLLFCKTLVIDGGEFSQTGGSNYIADTLVVTPYDAPWGGTGRYMLSGGQLTASNISVSGVFTCSGASALSMITNAGYFELSGFFETGGRSERLGPLRVGGTATIDLGGNGILRFADSSAMSWGDMWSSSTLIVTNWIGALAGGGSTRLLFGTNSTGLTPDQVRQIKFVNPGGLPDGTYSAQNLPSGEVIPDTHFILYETRESKIILTWFGSHILQTATEAVGPYGDLAQVTSPYINALSASQRRFFRLKP